LLAGAGIIVLAVSMRVKELQLFKDKAERKKYEDPV
jgi:hypothetical protein